MFTPVVFKIAKLIELPLSCFPLLVSKIRADPVFLLTFILPSLTPYYSNRLVAFSSSISFFFFAEDDGVKRWIENRDERE